MPDYITVICQAAYYQPSCWE